MQYIEDTNYFSSLSPFQIRYIINNDEITNNQVEDFSNQLLDDKYPNTNLTSQVPIKKFNSNLRERNLNKPEITTNTFENQNIYDCEQQLITENHNNNPKFLNRNISCSENMSDGRKCRKRPFHVSSIKARKMTMTMDELQKCLEKKLEERLLCKVPVKLVDRTHAKCGLCESIISLNKKFETIHVIRHFLAWHKTEHVCTRTWPGLKGFLKDKSSTQNNNLPQELLFFSESCFSFVLDNFNETIGEGVNSNKSSNISPYSLKEYLFSIRCGLCGTIMENCDVFTHFHLFHLNVINIPECNFCTQEVLLNAKLDFMYKVNFQISIINEGCFKSITTNEVFSGLDELYKNLCQFSRNNSQNICNSFPYVKKTLEGGKVNNKLGFEYSSNIKNSEKSLKPKRTFVHPKYRQAVPQNSPFVEEIETNHWRCKLCGESIVGAVISSAATKHFRSNHFENTFYFDEKTLKNKYNPMSLFYQFCMELCNARLSRCSEGTVRMLDEKTIVCGHCNGYVMSLHKDFNICRGIRHLKSKHPELMPEHKEIFFKEEVIEDKIEKDENNLVKRECVTTLKYPESIEFPYSTEEPTNSVTYVCEKVIEDNVEHTNVWNKTTLPNFPTDLSLQNNSSEQFYLENIGNHSSSSYQPSGEILPLTQIQIEDGYEDFFTKMPYKAYQFPIEKVDTILKIRDIDGRECYILMTENDNFDHDVASKIFYKNYTQV
ncbi:Hypothetical protein SRAE_1000050300 [Strongyloides ratti]|uniref:C2H2-type domain-containing protein n=1 Tax=Strongyloides ratti TaxID=34506 RepID=A0A090KXM1_STRRB|nr:Hypothetical protein SRAE_1000050300 [Strongyloides ratti]CEF62230.1 Hypothetical protein SRAE_1000050300 [Strongyloides ratti]